jgi:anti-sigma regulatory factor (Ser/Thr protein kinase)
LAGTGPSGAVIPPTVTQEHSACCRLRRDPAQVSQARRFVRQTLAEWSLDAYTDHTVLISSELVTNALQHGTGTIIIRLHRSGRHLRIEVHDHGAGRPVRRHAGTGDESGRGLAVIDGVISIHDGHRGCTDDGTGPGKTVHVVLPLITNAAGTW